MPETEPERRVGMVRMQERMRVNNELVADLVKVIKGHNTTPGLVTIVALLGQSLNKAWWWLGGISLVLLSAVGWVISGAF